MGTWLVHLLLGSATFAVRSAMRVRRTKCAIATIVAFGLPDANVAAASEAIAPTAPIFENNRIEDQALNELVASYFLEPEPDRRGKILSAVRSKSDDATEVAVAIRRIQLWKRPQQLEGTERIRDANGELDYRYTLPDDYDPAVAWPICVRVAEHMSPTRDSAMPCGWNTTNKELREPIMIQVMISSDSPTGDGAGSRLDLYRLLRAVRMQFHVDSDRVFLHADAASQARVVWSALLGSADAFAAVAIHGAPPASPYPNQLYPLHLESLRNLPVVLFFRDPQGGSSPVSTADFPEPFRSISEWARRESIPLTVAAADHPPPMPTHGRAPSKRISHWFRYPDEGRAHWLRQTRFAGEPWYEDQLSILPGPLVDQDEYITGVLKLLLAYLGGTVEGNRITIETRRCAEIEVSLFEGMVDFDQSIELYVNGKKRHERTVKPSVTALLREAFETWDFQRLTLAKLVFSIKEDLPPAPRRLP